MPGLHKWSKGLICLGPDSEFTGKWRQVVFFFTSCLGCINRDTCAVYYVMILKKILFSLPTIYCEDHDKKKKKKKKTAFLIPEWEEPADRIRGK